MKDPGDVPAERPGPAQRPTRPRQTPPLRHARSRIAGRSDPAASSPATPLTCGRRLLGGPGPRRTRDGRPGHRPDQQHFGYGAGLARTDPKMDAPVSAGPDASRRRRDLAACPPDHRPRAAATSPPTRRDLAARPPARPTTDPDPPRPRRRPAGLPLRPSAPTRPDLDDDIRPSPTRRPDRRPHRSSPTRPLAAPYATRWPAV